MRTITCTTSHLAYASMRHSNPIVGAVMDALTPLMRWMGPDLNRRTLDNIRIAGLEAEHVEDLGMGGIFKLIVARVPNGKMP